VRTRVPPGRPFRSTALAVAAITLLGVYAKSGEKHGDKDWMALAHGGAIGCLAFAQATPLIATGGDDATVKVWDARTGRLERSLQGHTAAVSSPAFSPDDRPLASGSFDRLALTRRRPRPPARRASWRSGSKARADR
jgi:hypothetical protein